MKNSSNSAIEEYQALRRIEGDMIDQVDKIARVFSIPRRQSVIAKAKIADAMQLISGTKSDAKVRTLDQVSKNNILKLVEEIGSSRPCVVLLRTEDGSGILELTTGYLYKFA